MCIVFILVKIKIDKEVYIFVYVEKGMEGYICGVYFFIFLVFEGYLLGFLVSGIGVR